MTQQLLRSDAICTACAHRYGAAPTGWLGRQVLRARLKWHRARTGHETATMHCLWGTPGPEDVRKRRRGHRVWLVIAAAGILNSAWGLVVADGSTWRQLVHAVLLVSWLWIAYRESTRLRRTFEP